MAEVETFGGQDGDFVVGEVDDLFGVAEERAGVACDEVFVRSDADDQWTAVSGGQNQVGSRTKQDSESVGAFEFSEGDVDRLEEGGFVFGFFAELDLFIEMMRDEMRDDLGVSFRLEYESEGLQLFAERSIVFDDAVMDEDDLSVAAGVRMRVFV